MGLVEVFSGLWGQRLFACWRCANTKSDALLLSWDFSFFIHDMKVYLFLYGKF